MILAAPSHTTRIHDTNHGSVETPTTLKCCFEKHNVLHSLRPASSACVGSFLRRFDISANVLTTLLGWEELRSDLCLAVVNVN